MLPRKLISAHKENVLIDTISFNYLLKWTKFRTLCENDAINQYNCHIGEIYFDLHGKINTEFLMLVQWSTVLIYLMKKSGQLSGTKNKKHNS